MPFAPVRYALKYQSDAWRRAFSHGGFPRFKSRGNDSFTIPQDVRIFNGRIHVPKIGRLALRRNGGNPYPDAKPVKAVIKQSLGKWYCVVVYDVGEIEKPDNGLAIGLDMNVGQVAVSTGEIFWLPDTSRLEARKRRHQRTVARRKKRSKRRAVAKRRVAKTARRIAQIRHNFAHCVSRAVADAAGTIVVEDLNVKAMTKKGGSRKLNREIRATGWSQLRQMLDYKAANVTAVNPAYTSQTCHECGAVDKRSRRSQSEFRCVHCGHEGNADVNAALNILASGIGAAGRRGGDFGRPERRQKVSDRMAS